LKELEQKKINDAKNSKLHERVKHLIDLIYDTKMMNKMMEDAGYDVKKMPLGKLSKENIKKGLF
jgi:poly [ADP-ribose] polymerase